MCEISLSHCRDDIMQSHGFPNKWPFFEFPALCIGSISQNSFCYDIPSASVCVWVRERDTILCVCAPSALLQYTYFNIHHFQSVFSHLFSPHRRHFFVDFRRWVLQTIREVFCRASVRFYCRKRNLLLSLVWSTRFRFDLKLILLFEPMVVVETAVAMRVRWSMWRLRGKPWPCSWCHHWFHFMMHGPHGKHCEIQQAYHWKMIKLKFSSFFQIWGMVVWRDTYDKHSFLRLLAQIFSFAYSR